jgi:hypothetical protein
MTADRVFWDRRTTGREVYDPGKGPKQIARRRDLPWHLRASLEGVQEFDFRDLAAMYRDGSGDAGFWVFQKTYGPANELLPYTFFSTPEIVFRSPEFGRRPAVRIARTSWLRERVPSGRSIRSLPCRVSGRSST